MQNLSCDNEFYLHENNFHMTGLALSLALKQRLGATSNLVPRALFPGFGGEAPPPKWKRDGDEVGQLGNVLLHKKKTIKGVQKASTLLSQFFFLTRYLITRPLLFLF